MMFVGYRLVIRMLHAPSPHREALISNLFTASAFRSDTQFPHIHMGKVLAQFFVEILVCTI